MEQQSYPKMVIQSNNIAALKSNLNLWEKKILCHLIKGIEYLAWVHKDQESPLKNLARIGDRDKLVEHIVKTEQELSKTKFDPVKKQHLLNKLYILKEEEKRIEKFLKGGFEPVEFKVDNYWQEGAYFYWDYKEFDDTKNKKYFRNILRAIGRLSNKEICFQNGYLLNISDEADEFIKKHFEKQSFYFVKFLIGFGFEYGKIVLTVAPSVVRFLSNCLKGFTKIDFDLMMLFRSAYTQRIYENLCRWHYNKNQSNTWIIGLEEFKKLLRIEDKKSYKEFYNVKRKILDKAKSELDHLFVERKSPFSFNYTLDEHKKLTFIIYTQGQEIQIRDKWTQSYGKVINFVKDNLHYNISDKVIAVLRILHKFQISEFKKAINRFEMTINSLFNTEYKTGQFISDYNAIKDIDKYEMLFHTFKDEIERDGIEKVMIRTDFNLSKTSK